MYDPLQGINRIKKNVSKQFADKYFRISILSLNDHRQLFKLGKNQLYFKPIKNVVNFKEELKVLNTLKNLGNSVFK